MLHSKGKKKERDKMAADDDDFLPTKKGHISTDHSNESPEINTNDFVGEQRNATKKLR
jgi:hypothetical protein